VTVEKIPIYGTTSKITKEGFERLGANRFTVNEGASHEYKVIGVLNEKILMVAVELPINQNLP